MWSQWRAWVFVSALTVASGLVVTDGQAALPVFAPPELVLELPSIGNYGILAAADFTGDGLLDVVVARGLFMTAEIFPLVILVNDGSGGFVDGTATIFVGSPPVMQNPRDIVIADFNGDGRPDIFIADHGDDRPPFPGFQNQLVLSTSDGHLVNTTANLPQQSDFTHSAATADIDGDGDLDLFIGNLGTSAGWGGAQIWLNDGTGRFTIALGRLPPEQTLRFYTTGHFADVNRDGKPDLILGGGDFSAQDSAVLLNDGLGFFSLLPNAMPPKPFASTANVVNIKSTDLNEDGFSDLLVAVTKSVPYYRGRWIQVLINNGNGTFRDETATRLPQADNNDDWIKFLELRDLDGDGDLDIATWLDANHTDPPPFYLNNGSGVFAPLPPGFGNISHNLYVFLDADGDGERDLLNTFPGCGTTCFPVEQHFIVRDIGPVIAPAIPRDVVASDGRFASKVQVSWSYVWGAMSYQVWRSSSQGSTGSLLGSATGTTLNDTTGVGGLQYYFVRASNSAGTSGFSTPNSGFRKTPIDLDGDSKSDVAVYQTSSGNWFFIGSTSGFGQHLNFGGTNFLPVPGDYDGDGETDSAVYHQGTGHWFINQSTAGFQSHPSFGGAGFIPVPEDYDGDGITDVAVYQVSTGHWFYVGSTSGFGQQLSFGGAGFIPVPGDYDGDGQTDRAVYQQSTGNWFINQSTAGFRVQPSFGGAGFIPMAGDYDGDGKSDVAVYQSSTAHWFFLRSTSGFGQQLSFGGGGFMPVPGDYDGDGQTDAAVYQQSTGHWFINQSTAGFKVQPSFGGAGFVPVLPRVTILRALGVL